MKLDSRARIFWLRAVLLTVELGLVLTTMSLLCCAYPEQFRKALWQIGGENGWNSNPRLRIYFYANYQQPPEIPLIWTQRLNESNLAISVLTVTISVVRVALGYFGVASSFSITYNALNDMLLSGFWMYSVAAQSSSDLTDPNHISVRPWYLEKSCNILDPSIVHFCFLAKACFAFSVLSLIFFFTRSVFSVLRLAYWCGSLHALDRGANMLHFGFRKYQAIDSALTLTSTQSEDDGSSVTIGELRILDVS